MASESGPRGGSPGGGILTVVGSGTGTGAADI